MKRNRITKMQHQTEWPSFARGQWFVWKPFPGIDPTLGDISMWLGAAKYAQMKSQGKPERESQNEAEKLAFENHYRVKYNL
jgi:hypothetical protein